MRLRAGLDRPTEVDILLDGASVLGVPVLKRNVAMVYQRVINYPTLTVYENIASPLRVAGADKPPIDRRVPGSAALLKLPHCRERNPRPLTCRQRPTPPHPRTHKNK